MTAITVPETGEVLREIPECDLNDPASLEAWHGNFGYAETFRKVLLGNLREVAKAKAAMQTPPVTLSDARADNHARCSDTYVDFLVKSLEGRIARERNVIASNTR